MLGRQLRLQWHLATVIETNLVFTASKARRGLIELSFFKSFVNWNRCGTFGDAIWTGAGPRFFGPAVRRSSRSTHRRCPVRNKLWKCKIIDKFNCNSNVGRIRQHLIFKPSHQLNWFELFTSYSLNKSTIKMLNAIPFVWIKRIMGPSVSIYRRWMLAFVSHHVIHRIPTTNPQRIPRKKESSRRIPTGWLICCFLISFTVHLSRRDSKKDHKGSIKSR